MAKAPKKDVQAAPEKEAASAVSAPAPDPRKFNSEDFEKLGAMLTPAECLKVFEFSCARLGPKGRGPGLVAVLHAIETNRATIADHARRLREREAAANADKGV